VARLWPSTDFMRNRPELTDKAEFKIRAARIDEQTPINEMILLSKAHWGYDEAFIEACRDDLFISIERIQSDEFRVLELSGRVVGTVEVTIEHHETHLQKLFVAADLIGSGAGRILFEWAVSRARKFNGAKIMLIESEPKAQAFYQHMGARLIGGAPSSVFPDRILPLLKFDL